MTSPMLAVVAAAFLAGAATAAFVMMVVGIRKVDRPRDLPPAQIGRHTSELQSPA